MGNLHSRKYTLSQNDFDSFLEWLDPDRESAGHKYEEVRRRLIKMFECRGCAVPEDLADETISRVIRIMGEISTNYAGDPTLYFYGVARKVHLEYARKSAVSLAAGPDMDDADDERSGAQREDCLNRCLQSLSAENRELILRYYGNEKGISIQTRKQLANELGIAPNTLRLREFRIRAALQNCVEECLKRYDG